MGAQRGFGAIKILRSDQEISVSVVPRLVGQSRGRSPGP